MKDVTPTTRQQRRARGASSRSESIRWKDRHDALMDVLNGILNAKGDGPEKRMAIGDAYFDAPRRPVIVEPMQGRVVVYLGKGDAPIEEQLSAWARFVAWLRRIRQ